MIAIVRGRVVDKLHVGVRDVVVHIQRRADGAFWQTAQECVTNARGEFSVSLASDSHELAGIVKLRRNHGLASPRQFPLLLNADNIIELQPGCAIYGTVHPMSKGAQVVYEGLGAEVEPGTGAIAGTTYVKPSGRFQVTGLDLGWYECYVRINGVRMATNIHGVNRSVVEYRTPNIVNIRTPSAVRLTLDWSSRSSS